MTGCLELPKTDSGDIGSIHWSYDFESEVLSFSGTGEIVLGLKEDNNGRYGYHEYSHLTKGVIINEGITGIGRQAFIMFDNMTTISIPNSVTRIRSEAFHWCSSLISVTIPDGVKSIGSSAFSGCNLLMTVTIGDAVTTIESMAFSDCWYLNTLTLGKSVDYIGDYAFSGCNDLVTVICYASTPPNFDTFPPFEHPENIELYVPSGSVNAYKNNSNWEKFKSISAIE